MIAQNIKTYLDKNFIRPDILLKPLNITKPSLYRMLNGKKKITFDNYIIICSTLGVDADYLYRLNQSENA